MSRKIMGKNPRTKMFQNFTIQAATVTLLLSPLFAGCGRTPQTRSQSSTQGAGQSLCIAVDGSGSTNERRRRYLGLIDATADAIAPDTRISLYRFDTSAREVYEGTIENPRDLWAVQDKELRPNTTAKGSRLDLLVHQLAEDFSHRLEKSIALVIISDGENTGRPLKPIITALAKDKCIRAVWIVGVDSGRREEVKREFAPFGSRLIVSGLEDVASGLKQFQQLSSSQTTKQTKLIGGKS